NRKASFEFEFIETFTAGMVLTGTEIKSIREGKASLQEAFCVFHKGELYVKMMHISPYKEGTYNNHELTRQRKLLLNKKELKKLESKMAEKGLTVIPTRLFLSQRGFAKLNIALAKGKKLHDKRQSIKDRDVKRDLSRMKY
ncbi:SsrA-binding protein SmpB, partial [Xanthovirga aplysinae]|uniref:SsrA-binding protein SmpB n=1 Tax=Xanthovirga aplysinae TaxID=2529853 RepID=UPI0012BCEB3B